MGKSGKKIKSDRINLLRKQYDEFLDEDKKRKDRNEFILGSLEKMRLYTPAVLPLRHIMGYPQINKYQVATQERPEYQRKVTFDNHTQLRSRHIEILDCVTKDEERLLQEIGKKYILIPKRQPKSENPITYYNPPNANNDTDWRNKYNILDELKKIEKEGSSEISITKRDIICNDYTNDHELSKSASKDIKEPKQTINIGQNYEQQKEEIPPITHLWANNTKAIPTNNLDYKVDCKTLLEHDQNITSGTDFGNSVILSIPKIDSIKQEHHISDSNKIKEESPREHVMIAEERNDHKMDENLTYDHVQDISHNEIKTTLNDIIPINTNTETVTNEPVSQNNTLELSGTENEDRNYTANLNDKQNIELHLEKDEIVANVVENMENEELCANIGQDEEQITQENEKTIIDDNIISSQIDEFETEQKEMFYSNEVEYNQNVEIMGNNTQSEGYTNEQYQYYNESQQDQPYYAEINEHEESTQRYDPSYEQQYAENYEDHANVSQYENQQYAVDNNYETQEVTNISYEPQPQQELTNVNYEQPYQQEVSTENFEQPVNYEYEHSDNLDNPDQHHVETTNTYDGQANEHMNYENQLYDEIDEHPTISDQNVYQSQEDYVHNTEHESTQNLEEQLLEKEGYTETKNTFPNEPATEVETVKMESNIKVT